MLNWTKSSKNVFLNPITAEQKLTQLQASGRSKVHIVADFDMTITKNYVKATGSDTFHRNQTAHGMFMKYSKSPPAFIQQTQSLIDEYFPIETSTKLTPQEKTPKMIEWWQKSHDLIVSLNLNKSDLVQMCRENPVEFRVGTHRLFEFCERSGIPMLIFSAGIADVIEEILKEHSLVTSSDLVQVVSNRMRYDGADNIVGFIDPIIHVYNKTETVISTQKKFARYKELVAGKPNVILIGDSLGDCQMAHEVSADSCVLKIGLLNGYIVDEESGKVETFMAGNSDDDDHFDEMLKRYLNVFDIVVCGDSSFDLLLNPLLESLSG